MFESIQQYLQDWSDACEYAAECWPDTPFLHLNQMQLREPYTALAAIAVGCFLVWANNERGLARRARLNARVAARPGRQTLVREMKREAARKLAA